MATAAVMPMSREASNYDEVSMQQSLLFSDSLKDLKNLRTQLYSAAEYFELSYTNDDQKQIMVETLKDYAIKALVNTVDHLGSVTYKVNDILDEKAEEVSGTELRVSCIEQRLRICQEYIDHEGISQQSLMINTPKYHKRYILPVGETMHGANLTKSKYLGCSLDEDDWHQFRNELQLGKPQHLLSGKSQNLQSEKDVLHHLLHVLHSDLQPFPLLPPCPRKNWRSEQYHRIDFHFYVLDLLAGLQPQIRAVQLLQILLVQGGGIHQSLGNQLQCVSNL